MECFVLHIVVRNVGFKHSRSGCDRPPLYTREFQLFPSKYSISQIGVRFFGAKHPNTEIPVREP